MDTKTDTNLTIKTNSEVKEQAQYIFSELGMDMNTAINVFLRQAIQHNGFPFEITLNLPNQKTLEAMEDAETDKIYGPYDSVSDLMEALNA